jgi:hypothetical protein
MHKTDIPEHPFYAATTAIQREAWYPLWACYRSDEIELNPDLLAHIWSFCIKYYFGTFQQ